MTLWRCYVGEGCYVSHGRIKETNSLVLQDVDGILSSDVIRKILTKYFGHIIRASEFETRILEGKSEDKMKTWPRSNKTVGYDSLSYKKNVRRKCSIDSRQRPMATFYYIKNEQHVITISTRDIYGSINDYLFIFPKYKSIYIQHM